MPELHNIREAIEEHPWIQGFLDHGFTVEDEERGSRSENGEDPCLCLLLSADLYRVKDPGKPFAQAWLELNLYDEDEHWVDIGGGDTRIFYDREPEVYFTISQGTRFLRGFEADLYAKGGGYNGDWILPEVSELLVELGLDVLKEVPENAKT